jgi:hypothetical protein
MVAEEAAAEWRAAAACEEKEDRQRQTERWLATAARAARAAGLRTATARAAEAARRTRVVAIWREEAA